MTEKNTSGYVDISHGLGAPFGGIGTGYFVYGRHGFTNVNFDGFPESQQTAEYPHTKLWNYLDKNPDEAPLALYLDCNGERTLLQKRAMKKIPGQECREFHMSAFMPFGQADIALNNKTDVSVLLYSSVKPHDLSASSIPACIFEFTIINHSDKEVKYELGLDYERDKYTAAKNAELLILNEKTGNISFGICGGNGGKRSFYLKSEESITLIAALAWFYPFFKTQGIAPDDIMLRHKNLSGYVREENAYERYYTVNFGSSQQVAAFALRQQQHWKSEIEKWHASVNAPDDFLRVWFGSYASAITATLYTAEGIYLEIEQPHGCLNTMDVSVYSTWLFMINWPEVEKKDLEQYIYAIPTGGETAGKVWHSLWRDGAHYVEEAIYALRIWRFALWSGDRDFLARAFDSVKLALEYIYRAEGRGNLINNQSGNQSYDAWKMPGIGAYVNNQWIYALFAYKQMCKALGKPEILSGRNLDDFIPAAVGEYNDILWNEKDGYWIAYVTNDDSNNLPWGDAIFSDQLFGHWAVAIDPESRNVLSENCEKRAAEKIYKHNRMEETEKGYSCWANGMLPEREKTVLIHKPDGEYNECGYHALTCWVSTQMDLASMLGYFGDEKQSVDMFTSVSRGMGRNVLAVGEYNRSVSDKAEPITSIEEPGKDTPRFPPYPRYKSSWEYLIRMLGLEMNFETITLNPFHSLRFSFENFIIGDLHLTVHVEKSWTRCLVNRKEECPVIKRGKGSVYIEFIQ